MKYTVTIEGETKWEIGDKIYVFSPWSDKPTMEDLKRYCNYEIEHITAIRPWIQWRLEWHWAIRFEYMCWANAYYGEDIFSFFKEWSFQRFYFNKEDAEKENEQRIKWITNAISSK